MERRAQCRRNAVRVIGATAGFIALLAVAGHASDESARTLLDQVRRLNQTTRKWTDRTQHMELEIVDRRGGARHRELEILAKKYGADRTRTIMFFHAPPPVRGIGFLQWTAPQSPDRQWLYLPALKRVRQITGTTKRESFVGTDFSYEDLSIMSEILNWTEDDARSALRGKERIEDQPCAIIELTPADVDVGYGTIRLWLGRGDQVVHKFEFETRTGLLAKTLLLSEIRMIGPIPAAHRLEMRNERDGSRTVVVVRHMQYDTGLADDVFSQRRLERGI